MTDETDKAPEVDCCSASCVVPFPASRVDSTENPILDTKAEPEVLLLIERILGYADWYNFIQKKVIANDFYNLLPIANELNHKLKELRNATRKTV